MKKDTFAMNGKEITLYRTGVPDAPLIVLNNYMGDGSSVVQALESIGRTELNLLCVGNLDWDHDMAPWYCPPLSKDDVPCTGGADDYLRLLVEEIVPYAREKVTGTPSHTSIAGFSLAGLFALYALYRTDIFQNTASMSGSLWFPGFIEYCEEHTMQRKPEKIYISLGDAETRTRNALLKTVRERTEALVAYYRALGLSVEWELNPGNHIKDAALRSAKGIAAIL